jgi:hypothetical protein
LLLKILPHGLFLDSLLAMTPGSGKTTAKKLMMTAGMGGGAST